MIKLKPAKFNPGWKLTLFFLPAFPALLALGFWQLEREQEKRTLEALYEARRDAPAVPLSRLEGEEDPRYFPVRLEGEYDNEKVFLLDNRTYQGRAGFEVIAPFATVEGRTVLINRGWIPLEGGSREILPKPAPVEGRKSVAGLVYVPAGEQVMLGDESPFDGWPRVIQSLDMDRMFNELGVDPRGKEVFPHTIRLAREAPGVLQRNWRVTAMSPERHRGYAVQWFSLAAVLAGLYIYAGFMRRSGIAG